MTIAEGKSRGRNKLPGEILIARRRIATAIRIGWPALEESWRLTLEELVNDHESRLDGPLAQRLDDAN
jgi:hypothetical protein